VQAGAGARDDGAASDGLGGGGGEDATSVYGRFQSKHTRVPCMHMCVCEACTKQLLEPRAARRGAGPSSASSGCSPNEQLARMYICVDIMQSE